MPEIYTKTDKKRVLRFYRHKNNARRVAKELREKYPHMNLRVAYHFSRDAYVIYDKPKDKKLKKMM